MKNTDNKLFEWCKILYYADINNFYYKFLYEQNERYYKTVLSLPSNNLKRYVRKLYIGLFLNAGLEIFKACNYSELDINKINIIFDIKVHSTNTKKRIANCSNHIFG
jgi:hypothetical protein